MGNGAASTRGVAWTMEVVWPGAKPAWFARCGDKSYGPTDLETAKQAAMAFARGAESFPAHDLAVTFAGQVNLNANPWVVISGTNHVP
jgi:hypothetical protein